MLRAPMVSVPRASRYPIRTQMLYRPVASDDWVEARTVNISPSGVLFEVLSSTAPATGEVELTLELSAIGPHVANVSCAGRIVRVERRGALTLAAATIDDYRFVRTSR